MGRPPMRRPCLERGCNTIAPVGQSRCDPHEQQVSRARNARRRSVPGDGAAARLRGRLNRAGAGTCGGCGAHLPAASLRVDHRQALSDGGTDTDPNCWLLCSPCHDDKSAAENRARAERQQ